MSGITPDSFEMQCMVSMWHDFSAYARMSGIFKKRIWSQTDNQRSIFINSYVTLLASIKKPKNTEGESVMYIMCILHEYEKNV